MLQQSVSCGLDAVRAGCWQALRSLRAQRREWAMWVVLIGVGCAVAILGAQLLRTTLLAPLPYPQAALQLFAIAVFLLGLSVIVALGPARTALRVPAMQVLRAQ